MDQFLQSIATTSATFVGKAAYSYAASLALKKIQSYTVQEVAATTTHKDHQGDDIMIKNYQSKLSRKLSVLLPILDKVHFRIAKGFSGGDDQADSITSLSKELQENLDKLALYSQESVGRSNADAEQTEIKLQNDQKRLKQFQIVLELVDEIIPLLQLYVSSTQWGLAKPEQVDGSSGSPISFSRLLKASSALVTGDALCTFKSSDAHEIQIGPTIPIRLYTLFQGSARKGLDFTWKEEYFKGICRIYRDCKSSSPSNERFYTVLLEQDLNDDRYHEEVDPALLKSKAHIPGEQRKFNVLDIAKMYYTSSGSLLNIDDSTMPVLVFKIWNSLSKSIQTSNNTSGTPKASGLKAEWLALELFLEPNDASSTSSLSDSEEESDQEIEKNQITKDMNRVSISDYPFDKNDDFSVPNQVSLSQLCFLEYLIRLCVMESRQGISHTKVSDFFFQEYFQNGVSGIENEKGKKVNRKEVASNQEPGIDSPSSRKASTRLAGGLLERFLGSGSGG